MADVWDRFPDAPKSSGADPWAQFPDAQQAQAPSAGERLARGTALTGRAAAQGVFSTLSAIPDALIGAENVVTGGINRLLGTKIPQAETYAQTFSRALDQAGAYTPETSGEKLAVAGIQGGAGALTGAGLLGAPSTVNAIRSGISGVTGGISGEYAKQKGVGPIGQFAATLAGGMAPTVAETGGRALLQVGRSLTNLGRPLTRGGQQQIAANALYRQAEDPAAAEAELNASQPNVPNSDLTSGPASKDVGLLKLEKGLRGKDPTPFGVRTSEQNLARQTSLDRIAGSPADIEAATNARTATTTPMREAALNAGGTADITPVMDKIDTILASPVGKRDVPAQALSWLKTKLSGETDPANLYAVRQDINDAIAGKLGGEQSKYRLAQGQLIDVRGTLDDAIEQAAPGFKAYLQRYSELSKPIDQMKVLQEIQRRSALAAGADITTGRDFLSPAKFGQQLQKAAQSGVKLTPTQVDTLNAIKTDLDYGAAINSPLIKAAGSDTYQNLSIASAIGSGANSNLHPIIEALVKPIKWLYKAPDDQITKILTDAMLDPKLAAMLLKRATPQSVNNFSNALRVSLKSSALGTTASQVANSTSQEAPTGSPP